MARDVVSQLLATDVALDKLGAHGSRRRRPSSCREIATSRLARERDGPGKRLLLIGHTDGGRVLTPVLERTADPTTWLIVTGWSSTEGERKILEARR